MSDPRKGEKAEKWWQIWLNEIESAQPDLGRAIHAAQQLAAHNISATHLRQWLAVIRSDANDPLTCEQAQTQLPDFLATQTQESGANEHRFAALRTHLALCPFCMAAYVESAELLTASLADTVLVSKSYLAFDLAFLASPTASPVASARGLTERIQDALAAGQRWLEESAGEVLLLFGPSLQSQPTTVWATKSGEAGALLAQMVLTDEEVAGWEITVAAFSQAGSDDLCQIEVALYRPDLPVEGIAVHLSIGQEEPHTERHGQTDAGGVVVFNDLPIAHLPKIIVRADLGPSQ